MRRIFICLTIGILFFCSFLIGKTVLAATYTVNSPIDSNDGSCIHPYSDSNNDCTLREAIIAANSNSGADTITFAMDSSFQSDPDYYDDGQYTITLDLTLTSITEQIILSAASSWDETNDRPGIRLYSSSTTLHAIPLSSTANNSQISGLEIEGFGVATSVNTSDIIIGTNCDGTNDEYEKNVLHGGVNGIILSGTNGIVAGNIIGLDFDGTTYDGYSAESVLIDGTNADYNTIGFREGTTSNCSAATQRNSIAGTTGSYDAVYLKGTESNVAGDSELAPDHNIIAGNYIGTDSSGTLDRSGKQDGESGSGYGVHLSNNATLNWIGTDGDGIDDAFEKNIIFGASVGVSTYSTGTNRIAGNYIGVNATGNAVINGSMTVGVVVQGQSNIIGWCTTADHLTLCSNDGNISTQRNVIGGATTDQIRFGAVASGSYIYGNFIGVGIDGESDVSDTIGLFVHRASSNNIFGGTGNKANTVQGNTIGVKLDGNYTGNRTTGNSQSPITNTTVTYNTISDNDTTGIQLYWTENFADSSITISNNTINNNGTAGIEVIGSSPTITNNTISTNGTYGVYIYPGFIARNIDGWHANEAGESYDPADAATNILSSPTITGNTISENTNGGMYQLDTRASNYTTLFTDNTISNNNDQPAITQAWYGAIELLDGNSDPILGADISTTTITLHPQAASGAEDTDNVDSAEVAGTDNIFGIASVDYADVRTWFTVIDYTVSDASTTTSYNAYTITSAGTYTNTDGAEYSFDGTDNDEAFSGVLANGITTDGLYRFQIAKTT